jgi:autotransporter-associated beta strand protein
MAFQNWGGDDVLRVGVNGATDDTGELWGSGRASGWVFVAFTYDSTITSGPNATVITGGPSTAASVADNNLWLYDWSGGWPGVAVGTPAVGSTATAYLANNGSNTAGYSGNLDDVRIYNSLLTVEEIEAVRQAAFAEPLPPVALYWKGNVDNSWVSSNWTEDVAGTIPGSLLTDGTQGVAFGATGAANLSTILDADQSVNGIVVMNGAGPVDVSGDHSLTIGGNGIWLEQTAEGLYINTIGGVILNESQLWKNKSPNDLVVDSDLSGSGTLTKGGVGTLRLGGDSTLRTGGTVVELGTLAIDHPNALGDASASLVMAGGTLDLNGLDVTLGALAGTGESVIHSSEPVACTLTLDTATDGTYSCKINDGPGGEPVSLVKKGTGKVTASSSSNFTGSVLIEDGEFVANQPSWGAPTSSSFGNAQVPGRTITVNYPGLLSLTYNNIFGNQYGDLSKLPAIIVNDTTMSSTSYNLIGDITLSGASLTQSAGNAGDWQGYQFKGNIKVTGSGFESMISGSGGNHLGANTVFDVEEVTGDTWEDLLVYSPLIDQSGDFGLAPGGLTKTGAGTMLISSACTYSGDTNVNEGLLVISVVSPFLSDTGALRVASGAGINLDFVGTDLVGSLELGGVPQTAVGTYGAIDSGADFESALITGTGLIEVQAVVADPFADWIAGYNTLTGPDAARGADHDHDGLTNIQEFAFGSAPDDSSSTAMLHSAVATVSGEQALVLTLPVRDGAVFAGNAPAEAALASEAITYQIGGTNDLISFNQTVSEVTPALSSGLPALSAGWSYRTFRLEGEVGGATPRGPKGFLRAAVVNTASAP